MPLSGIVLIIGILLGITTLIGILGNISVCLVVFWNRSMRTQLHLLLVNLAIADVGMSASCMPFAVATVLFQRVSCTFFRFQVYERVGKSVISAGKDPKGQITNAIKDLEEVEETFRFQYKCGIFIVKI